MKCKKIQEKEKVNLRLQKKKKVKKLKEKGITLIALVVTIIILLILVGVTISQITGENGLIKRAKEAVERYKNASEEELIQLGKINQYVSDFEIIGGNEGEENLSSKEQEMKNKKKVIEIKKGLSSKTTQTISLKEIEGYESFSANNFFIVCKELKYEFHSSVKDVLTISKSYNKDKGELTLGPLTSYFTLQNTNNGIAGVYIIYDVYYIE